MRPLWSGFIGFGLANIPVNLYSPTAERQIDLDFLHEKDLSPVRYARICRAEEKEIPYEDIVRGAKQGGSHVVLEEADFERANVRKTSTIEIEQFAGQDEIDPVYFEKPYYLEPKKGAERAFQLFRDALRRSKKVGIAKFVLRTREHLAAIRPYERTLVLQQMRFADELSSTEKLTLPKERVIPAREMALAQDLIRKLTRGFNVAAYKDTYSKELRQIIKEKARGVTHKKVRSHEKPKTTHADDLMRVLRASLEEHAARPRATRAHR